MTVREWWHEMDESISMLSDRQAIFIEGERELPNLCLANSIGDRPATSERPTGSQCGSSGSHLACLSNAP